MTNGSTKSKSGEAKRNEVRATEHATICTNSETRVSRYVRGRNISNRYRGERKADAIGNETRGSTSNVGYETRDKPLLLFLYRRRHCRRRHR